ncbi:pilus assembly protein PilN [Bradyrhizobium macuxiense]|uniref:Pilus assembly protein PilN n=1 Tax=Bradyrhizobium macuxiense TaxID=1755647 RepID=A0A109J7V9_9BRAD|nr:PilN domain-containing protein [Bradyrhizobium macuxiense]KWV43975.1 pilus assembly protein PilN [Bradyrhizobium macuxiense]
MKWVSTIGAICGAWTGSVAGAIVASVNRIVSPRVVRLVETDDDGFEVETTGKVENVPSRIGYSGGALSAPNLTALFRGKRVEIVLRPKRFLFRPLELPARATDFVEGIVRAQIDRLTPWTASEAVFGCTAPIAESNDTITTMIAATTRKVATGYVQAVTGFHPSAVAVCTNVEGHAGHIKVFEQSARGHLDAARMSRALQLALGIAAVVATFSVSVSAYVANNLDAQGDELARQISARRAAIRAGGGDRSPIAALERRKFETPASVIVLEMLSRVLPDHTYVTELHLAGSKLQISGVTADASSLIPLIERSQHFTRATFYAPTTRAPSDPGERFHIEARIVAKNSITVAP